MVLSIRSLPRPRLLSLTFAGLATDLRSRDALSVTLRASGEATQLAGHRITVYRKQPDGRWLLARDAHTLSPVEKLGS